MCIELVWKLKEYVIENEGGVLGKVAGSNREKSALQETSELVLFTKQHSRLVQLKRMKLEWHVESMSVISLNRII